MSVFCRRCATVFAAAALFTLNATAAIPSVEKLLPDDTLFLITTPDFAKARETYKTSPQMQLWNDPSMQPFKDKFVSKLQEELIQPLERDLGVKVSDYEKLPQGQVTFAITQNDWMTKDDQGPGMLLLLDSKDNSDQLKKNLGDLRKKWLDSGKPLKTEKIRGTEFLVLPISQKDMPKTLRKFTGNAASTDADSETNGAPKSQLVIGQYESLLIIGNSLKPVEKVLVHLTGGAMPALGDLAAYEANRLAMFRDAPFYGWANAKAFIDLLNRKPAVKDSDTPDPMTMFNPEKILGAMGVNGMKTLAFSTQTSPDGSTFQLFVGVPESTRQGLFKLFPSEAKDSTPPPFVPADAIKFQRYRIDGQKAWATIQKVANEISPQALSGINFILGAAEAAAKEKDPSFDINKNLFGNLGDDLISYEKAPRGTTAEDLKAAPSLFLIGSPRPDQLASALKSVLVFINQQGGSPTEREFLGRKIYSVPLPAVPLPGGQPGAPRALSYAASGGYVAISTDPSILEEYLRSGEGDHKSLRETSGLTDAIAKVGGSSTGWLGYENQTETTRAAFEALRKGSATNTTASALAPGISSFGAQDSFKEWMDFSLLPPFEKISKYFGFSVYAGSSSTDGLIFKMFAPVPAGLKK